MVTSITILAGVSAVTFGRFLSSRPALLDTSRLPAGMRFSEPEALAVAAVLRFGGLLALVGLFLAVAIRAAIS